MTTTTPYGTWYDAAKTLTVETTVADLLGDYTRQYDLEAIAEDFRQAVNEALPEGYSLAGNDFYAPFYEADRHLDGYSTDPDGNLDLGALIEGIDLQEIADRHEVPELTSEHRMALEVAQAPFAVLYIESDPEHVGNPLKLVLWDSDDPAPGIVAIRSADLTEAWDSVAEKWNIEPDADVLDSLRPLVVKAARAARSVKAA